MRSWIRLFLILVLTGACKTQQPMQETGKEEFEIEIMFDTDEAVKVVPYRLSAIQLRLNNAREDHGAYRGSITVDPDQVNDVVEKIINEDGVKGVELIGKAIQDP